MRFSIQPEPRPELRMITVSIDEIVQACEMDPGDKPPLEHYFSPTKKDAFIKDFLHYLNTSLLDARHGKLTESHYLVLVLLFQFIAPLLEIPAEKELGLFFRILQKNYQVEEVDLNIHFDLEEREGEMIGEEDALKTYREELRDTYEGTREVRESVQKRLKKDAIEAIMGWQREQNLPNLARAFGRSVVIPSFFSCTSRKLIAFYKESTGAMNYRVAIPAEIHEPDDQQ